MSERVSSRKLVYGLLGLTLVYSIVRSLIAAAGKGFWYDELLTLAVSSQASWKGILSALRAPLDGQPPFFYVIENLASHTTKNEEIGFRLPSILAVPFTLTCVFVCARKRSGQFIGLLSALFLLMSAVFQSYAIEARPYSKVVACIAFAMVCYQNSPAPRWMVLLAISLVLAQSLHYLAFLSVVPFGLAEANLLLVSRKFRWPVWTALVAGGFPLLLSWGLLRALRVYYGEHFWARFQFSFIPRVYGELLGTTSQIGAGIGATALAGILGAAWLQWSARAADPDAQKKVREAVVLFSFSALPFVGYVFASVTHSGMTARYVLPSVIGLALAFGYIISQAKHGATLLFAVFVLSAVGVHELHFWQFSRSNIKEVQDSGIATEKFIQSAGHEDLPVVVPNGLTLVRLVHYTFHATPQRFVYLTQAPQTISTVDQEIELMKPYLRCRIVGLSEFVSTNSEFLLYTEDTDTPRDWLTLRLQREGWLLQTAAIDQSRSVYFVASKKHSFLQPTDRQ